MNGAAAPAGGPWAGACRAAAAALALLAIGNAWQYSASAAGPLLQADAWYFLEVFLSKYFEGGLGVLDLFVQRGGGDHAQPLQKLVLLFHTRWFDMDFRIEGLVGTAAGIAWCAVLAAAVWAAEGARGRRSPAALVTLALVFVLGLSINASNVFTWSLVTLGYLPLLVATLYLLAAQRLTEGRWPWLLMPAAFLLGIAIDEMAIIVFVATLLALALFSPAPRRRQIAAGASALAGLLAARGFIWLVSGRGLGGAHEAAAPLAEVIFSREALHGVLIPFADGLIHVEHLARRFPDDTALAMLVAATFVALLHLWFWLRVLLAVKAGRRERTPGIAVFLMLIAYASTAGIISGRVAVFGWDYLHQPRYVLFYQLGLVAVAILFSWRLGDAAHARSTAAAPGAPAAPRRAVRIAETACIAAATAALLVVQLAAARASWQLPPYLTPYWQNAALAMQALADDPANPPACPDIMTVCDSPLETRQQLMALLVERQLNVFSHGFQMRNRIYPSLERIPGFADMVPAAPAAEPAEEPAAEPAGEPAEEPAPAPASASAAPLPSASASTAQTAAVE